MAAPSDWIEQHLKAASGLSEKQATERRRVYNKFEQGGRPTNLREQGHHDQYLRAKQGFGGGGTLSTGGQPGGVPTGGVGVGGAIGGAVGGVGGVPPTTAPSFAGPMQGLSTAMGGGGDTGGADILSQGSGPMRPQLGQRSYPPLSSLKALQSMRVY